MSQGAISVSAINAAGTQPYRGAQGFGIEQPPQWSTRPVAKEMKSSGVNLEATSQGGPEGKYRHAKGCSCKRSRCLKKYCECFQAGIPCDANCKCTNC